MAMWLVMMAMGVCLFGMVGKLIVEIFKDSKR